MDTNLGAVVTGESELETHLRLAHWLGVVVDGCLYAAIVLVPLFFLPFTLDILELNKQTLLLVLSSVGLLAWVGRAICLRRVTISRSWLHLVVVVFLAGYAVTSWFSLDRYLSFAGNFGQMQWAIASVTSFAVLYFLLVNTVKGTTKLYHLILAFLGSSVLLGVYGFLQLVVAYPLAKGFNTIGTINSFGVFMTIPLILAASLTVLGCRDRVCVLGQEGRKSKGAKGLVWAALGISLLVAIVVDYWVVWAAILFGTTLLVLIPLLRTRRFDRPVKLVIPSVLVALSIGLLLFRTPVNLSLPNEVSPSTAASWSIARQTLQERPFFGSGPGTWIYDYAKYRSPAVNLSQFWTTRFERGISTFLTLLASIGLVGIAFWLILLVSAVAKSAHHLVSERNDDAWQAYLTVFTGWATTAFIAFVYNYNFTHHFVFWFLFALLASLVANGSLTWDAKKSVTNSALLSFVFLLLCAGAVSVIWLSGQRLVADAKYSAAVSSFRSGKPIQESIDRLASAVALNRWNDSYYRNLSQAYLIRAGQELQAAPDADRAKKVNTLVTAAIDNAKRATEVSPANVDNWANFAVTLQAIASFTRGADEKAIEMYRTAMALEPNNPAFMNEIGKLHILRADAYRQLVQSNDERVRRDAETNINKELDTAAEALNQSIQAKPDFAEAHYNLGLVYERQGRVRDAITKLEQVLAQDNKNVGIAFQLAILYYRDNEKDKSQDVFEQIVALEPNYSNARWYLSVLYEERARYDDAIAQVQKVAELNPENEAVLERMKSLVALRDRDAAPAPGKLPEPVKEEIGGPPEQNKVKQP